MLLLASRPKAFFNLAGLVHKDTEIRIGGICWFTAAPSPFGEGWGEAYETNFYLLIYWFYSPLSRGWCQANKSLFSFNVGIRVTSDCISIIIGRSIISEGVLVDELRIRG